MASPFPSPPSISAIRAQSSSLNLLPLQRIDAQIQAVVLTAKHTVLYTLDQSTETWEREDVEGPFFLVERSSAPYYAMTILNRRSIDNFTQHIQPDMTFEIQENYLFFQVHDDVIGVWFYEQPEAVQAADALNKVVQNLQNSSFRPPPPTPAPLPTPSPSTSKPSPSRPKPTSSPSPSSSPSPHPTPRKPPPPIIHTQQGKRLHRKAPPPPTLQLHVGVDGGDARALERRLGEFMAAFHREDEQHRKAHEEEVKRVDVEKRDGGGGGGEKVRRDEAEATTGSDGAVPLPLAALFKAAQGGGQLPPMPGAVGSNGVAGFTSAQELEKKLKVSKQEGREEEGPAPAMHPLLSQLFSQSMRPSSPPPSQLLSPASLLAASPMQSFPPAQPAPSTSLCHLSVLLPPHLSFDAFRHRLLSLVHDQQQLTRWYADYNSSASSHPSPF